MLPIRFARPIGGSRLRFLPQLQIQLRLHEENRRRPRILRLSRSSQSSHGLPPNPTSTATDFSRHRPQPVAQVGSQLRPRRRGHAFHRSSHRQNDPRLPLRLLIWSAAALLPLFLVSVGVPFQKLSRNHVALFNRSLFAMRAMFPVSNKLHRGSRHLATNLLHLPRLRSRIKAPMQK
jgi:hypothetical protein